MDFLQPIADLFGLSPAMLLVLSALFVILVGVWYVLKFVVKLAWKVMTVGCAAILVIMAVLYILALIVGTGN